VSFRHFDLDLPRGDRPPADAHPLWATGAARLWPPVTSFRESPPVVAPGSTPPACLSMLRIQFSDCGSYAL
jgi:hypothetical protein